MRRSLTPLVLLVSTFANIQAQEKPPDKPRPVDKRIILRLESGGPTSLVTAVAFSPDGQKLYAAGVDKVVRVWTLNDDKPPKWVISDKTYRVPIGPGRAGAINALAVSPDGKWLAVGGLSIFRGGSDFDRPGLFVPPGEQNEEELQDEGMIYAIDVNTMAVKGLRGHRETVTNLSFAPNLDGKPPMLVSTAHKVAVGREQPELQVRLWDVTNAKSVAKLDIPTRKEAPVSFDPRSRPGLAIRHTGKDPKQVLVAIAWYDGLARFWDVAADDLMQYKNVASNRTALYHPGRQAFVIDSMRGVDGQLSAWTFTDARPREAKVEKLATLPASDPTAGPFFFPRSLTLLPVPGKTKDGAAVIVRRQGERGSSDDVEELVLLDLENGEKLAARYPLGTVTIQPRLLAASPDGRYLAIADGDHNRVLVHTVTDLIAGNSRPQELRSFGTTFRRAAFVKKGADQGLVLNEAAPRMEAQPREPEEGDVIFDFAGRKFSADRKDWKLDAADVGDWKVRQPAKQPDSNDEDPRPFLLVRQGRGEERAIRMVWTSSSVTAYALAPTFSAGDKNVPLLAAATLDWYGQPILNLYRADTGARLRFFNAHVGAIRSLAFSSDGKRLVSTSEDQTVCVWTLNNVDVLLNKGRLLGVGVEMKDNKLVVVMVDEASDLKKGDVIEGIVEDGKVVPIKEKIEFYERVFNVVKPGQKVTLSIRDKKNVELTAIQGVDERKPLFTLFVKRAAKPEDSSWIGWNPVGPYEVSDEAAEGYVGWHFNTGKDDAPTSFAKLGQYKKDHEKKSILQALVRREPHRGIE